MDLHHKIKAIIVLILFNFNLCLSQNEAYGVYSDSIYPKIETDYYEVKKIFVSLNESYNIDPNQKYNFAYHSLKNDDVDYFKKLMKDLILNYGFKYSKYDISLKSNNLKDNSFSNLLKRRDLENWLFNESDSLFPLWIKENPRSFEVRTKIQELVIVDQSMRIGFPDFDSLIWDAISIRDYKNFQSLLSLCDSNGILPNNFDQGYGSLDWFYIFLHNIKSYQTLEIWDEFLPYLEKTYFAGKISNECFIMYDRVLIQFYGYQYYGFFEDVPVKDEKGLYERRLKYGFI